MYDINDFLKMSHNDKKLLADRMHDAMFDIDKLPMHVKENVLSILQYIDSGSHASELKRIREKVNPILGRLQKHCETINLTQIAEKDFYIDVITKERKEIRIPIHFTHTGGGIRFKLYNRPMWRRLETLSKILKKEFTEHTMS